MLVRPFLSLLLLPCGVPGCGLSFLLGLGSFPLGKRRFPCIELGLTWVRFLDGWFSGHVCVGRIRSGFFSICLRLGLRRLGFGWRWLGSRFPVNDGDKRLPIGIRETCHNTSYLTVHPLVGMTRIV